MTPTMGSLPAISVMVDVPGSIRSRRASSSGSPRKCDWLRPMSETLVLQTKPVEARELVAGGRTGRGLFARLLGSCSLA